jgi:hypothetical protein
VRIRLCAQQRWWLSWGQGHYELIEGERQAFTPGFDVGFLTRPTAKKCRRLEMAREATEHRNLGQGEELLSDRLAHHIRADAFDIDAKLTAVADGKEG